MGGGVVPLFALPAPFQCSVVRSLLGCWAPPPLPPRAMYSPIRPRCTPCCMWRLLLSAAAAHSITGPPPPSLHTRVALAGSREQRRRRRRPPGGAPRPVGLGGRPHRPRGPAGAPPHGSGGGSSSSSRKAQSAGGGAEHRHRRGLYCRRPHPAARAGWLAGRGAVRGRQAGPRVDPGAAAVGSQVAGGQLAREGKRRGVALEGGRNRGKAALSPGLARGGACLQHLCCTCMQDAGLAGSGRQCAITLARRKTT